MARPLPLLFAVLAGFAVASACYAERQAPPTFRYKCSSDSECNENERCVAGLCQVPCTQLTFDDVCVQQNHLACFNGLCSTGCTPSTDDNPCPESQTCINAGFSVSGGSFIGGGEAMQVGVCGNPCTDGSCPEGETCLADVGICFTSCPNPMGCPDGTACFMDVCIPEQAVPGDDGAVTNADGGSSDGDTEATTGGAT